MHSHHRHRLEFLFQDTILSQHQPINLFSFHTQSVEQSVLDLSPHKRCTLHSTFFCMWSCKWITQIPISARHTKHRCAIPAWFMEHYSFLICLSITMHFLAMHVLTCSLKCHVHLVEKKKYIDEDSWKLMWMMCLKEETEGSHVRQLQYGW